MQKKPKSKPSHERIASAKEDLEVAELAHREGRIDIALTGYRYVVQELEGMSHYDDFRQDILLRLAYICIDLGYPDQADDYAIKSCALIKDPDQSHAVYDAFETAWYKKFPHTPEAPLPGVVVPFKRPSNPEPPKIS